jgi:hypothetical protein
LELTVHRTLATESGLEDTIGVEYLYPIVIRIGYIDITTSTDGDTVGASELTVPRTIGTESGLEDTTRVKYLYPIVVRIGYIDITTSTGGDTTGEHELTVPRTFATESEGKTGRSGTGGDTNTSDRSGRD